MSTPKWQAGHLYPPGSLVQPLTLPPADDPSIPNAGFEAGTLAGWTAPAQLVASNAARFDGSWSIQLQVGNFGAYDFRNDTRKRVIPGQVINAQCMIHQGASSTGNAGGLVKLYWYDENDVQLPGAAGYSNGNNVNSASGGAWLPSRVRGVAPAGAAFVRIGGSLYRNGQNFITNADTFTWDYQYAGPPEGLIFKAVQPAAGYSDDVEPVWPTVLGVQVVDNEVIWEAILATRVIWQASPIMKSGPVEPAWPTTVGGFVADNTVSWECVSLRIEDENCPNSKIVAILKSKIYAGDGDIVRYCATLRPRDWTTARDAGYIGTGMNANGANEVSLLNVYRSNLIVMSPTSFQQWMVDPDPALMSLLDSMEGIGSSHQKAAQSVANDLFYLANLGVRTIGISGATENLKAGDIGLPIDTLVQAALRAYAPRRPISMYFPSSGQYWLIFATETGVAPYPYAHSQVFVYTLNQVGQVGAWSRYIFPFDITYACQKGDAAFVRTGNQVYELNEIFGTYDFYESDLQTPFNGMIQWPWLDMGMAGADKMIHGFDIVGYGTVQVQFGYDQTNVNTMTEPYEVSSDTLTGQPIMFPLTAPSYSVRLIYEGGQNWGFNAMNIYLDSTAP